MSGPHLKRAFTALVTLEMTILGQDNLRKLSETFQARGYGYQRVKFQEVSNGAKGIVVSSRNETAGQQGPLYIFSLRNARHLPVKGVLHRHHYTHFKIPRTTTNRHWNIRRAVETDLAPLKDLSSSTNVLVLSLMPRCVGQCRHFSEGKFCSFRGTNDKWVIKRVERTNWEVGKVVKKLQAEGKRVRFINLWEEYKEHHRMMGEPVEQLCERLTRDLSKDRCSWGRGLAEFVYECVQSVAGKLCLEQTRSGGESICGPAAGEGEGEPSPSPLKNEGRTTEDDLPGEGRREGKDCPSTSNF